MIKKWGNTSSMARKRGQNTPYYDLYHSLKKVQVTFPIKDKFINWPENDDAYYDDKIPKNKRESDSLNPNSDVNNNLNGSFGDPKFVPDEDDSRRNQRRNDSNSPLHNSK